jgi:hypothetical protein
VSADRATKLLDAMERAHADVTRECRGEWQTAYRRRALRLIREALAEQREESRDAGLMDGAADERERLTRYAR